MSTVSDRVSSEVTVWAVSLGSSYTQPAYDAAAQALFTEFCPSTLCHVTDKLSFLNAVFNCVVLFFHPQYSIFIAAVSGLVAL